MYFQFFCPVGLLCVVYSTLVILMIVGAQTPNSFSKTALPNGTMLCAVGAPSAIIPVSQLPDYDSTCVPNSVKCAWKCQQEMNCVSFNYNNAQSQCELFAYQPVNFAPSGECIYYQDKNDQASCSTSVGRPNPIPAENCSFPFTYNTYLYFTCSANLTGNGCNVGCLLDNRNLTTCQQPLGYDYVAEYVLMNSTLSGYTLVRSINNWIIIQQRIGVDINFTRNWANYTDGFGNTSTDYWLGLEKMNQLTTATTYRLRILLQSMDNGKWFSADYDTFQVGPSSGKYVLSISGYTGDGGDSLEYLGNGKTGYQNGMKFSTYDADNDNFGSPSCIQYTGAGGGFWYNACMYGNLNNPYGNQYFYWHSITALGLANKAQLVGCSMLIKAV